MRRALVVAALALVVSAAGLLGLACFALGVCTVVLYETKVTWR